MEPTQLDLATATGMLRAGEISALELTELFLERAIRLNSSLAAFITLTPELAREQALRVDEERGRGIERGPLQGIPFAAKDLFETRGVRTTAGASFLLYHVPEEDATVVARLAAAGAVMIGKSNMHEWAYGVTNDNPHTGRSRNPWDLKTIPGGSSGGSAAAVAARLCLGALGTDTGGSIRIPSALCGVTGLKPTRGRVSLHGVIPLSWSMDHAGPIAQTAEDCALLLQTIAGYDPLDPASVDVPVPDYTRELDAPLNGLVVSVPGGYFAEKVDAEVLEAIAEAARVLKGEGVSIVEKELPFAEELFTTNRVILSTEAAAYHEERMKKRPAGFGEDVHKRLRNGVAIRAPEYARAVRRQAELIRALELYFSGVDLLLTPTTRIPAPRFEHDAVTLSQDLTAFTAPFNLTGLPAISVPCGFTRAGLPIGMQLIARPWNEALVLRAAHGYQQATSWHRRVPDVG